MIYKPFKELKLSHLGMGNMRLPTSDDKGTIDEMKAREIIEYAYEHGINYFDTAYRYHGGASEPFVGKVLKQYPRDSWYIASKMPGHMMKANNGQIEYIGYLAGSTMPSIDYIFCDQLERCGVDYFDFYLLHNIAETSFGFYTDEQLRVVEYLQDQQKAGRIRHLGFSAHGRAETIEKFLDIYDCFEFVQIQLNYMDWYLQNGKQTYDMLTRRGIPVIAMEPCRGGKLATLKDDATALLKAKRPDASIASWAFRFLQSLPNLLMTLSGMTTLEQLKENIAIYSTDDPTDAEEAALLRTVVEAMADTVPCTACAYCKEGCPQSLDIPKLISLYNEMKYDNPGTMQFTLNAMQPEEMPAACISCGACSQLCPQNIAVPDVLKGFADMLG